MNRPGQDRTQFAGKRLAIVGLGVSGIAMAEAAVEIGAEPLVFEEKPGTIPEVLAAIDRLAGRVEVVTGWTANLPAGFDWVLVSPGVPPGHPVIAQGAVPVIGEAEFAYRIANAPILAITGTNGKSTTTVMLSRILATNGAVLCGNIAGSGYAEQTLTSAALSTPSDGVLVAEVSSAQMETVVEFRPEVATITNLQPDHLDRYKTFEQYKLAKLNLLKNLGSEQFFVRNLDEPSLQSLSSPNANLIEFSPSGNAAGNGQTRRFENTLSLSDQELAIADLPFVGEMNIANAMCAWEMAAAFLQTRGEQIGSEELASLLDFKSLAHRLEPLGERGGIRVINNSMCTNPRAVVESAKSLTGNLHILMGGNPKNLDFSEVRVYLRTSPHKVYLYGVEASDLREKIGLELNVYPSLEAAFEAATQAARSGETVILSPGCSSTAPFANFRERGDAFKKCAREWLTK